MKFMKIALSVATVALGVASAASTYSVTFSAPTKVGSQELKAGDYKVEVKGDKATFRSGKTTVEVPAMLATGDKKYAHTSVALVDSKVKEIELGGTASKLTFPAEGAPAKGN